MASNPRKEEGIAPGGLWNLLKKDIKNKQINEKNSEIEVNST